MQISACLIVKNEESCLAKCLSTLSGFDEIVVVDTGSTDRTVEIAKQFTDKVFTDYTWEESFCKARNHAQSKCAGDWVFVIDADEWLEDPENTTQKIRKAIEEAEQKDKKTISCLVKSCTGNHSHRQPRLYRVYHNGKSTGIHWKGDVHNYLSYSDSFESSQTIVVCAGYSETHTKDPDRALRMLKKAVADNPNAVREVYYLAREYWYKGKLEEAVTECQKYLSRAKWLPEIADAYLIMARCLWHLRRGEEARRACLQAINCNANFKEAILFMAEMSWPDNKKRWIEFAKTATNKNVLFVREQHKIKQHI